MSFTKFIGFAQVGLITATYDRLGSHMLPFPTGFQHDISLATSDDLSSLSSPSGAPRIVGWGPHREVLDGHPLFAASLNVHTGDPRIYAGTGISAIAQEAIVEGSQYFWDRELLTQSVSILWRTEQDHDSLTSLSGSVLCMGRLQDQTCCAVCFQNFESALYSPESLRYDHRPLPDARHPTPKIKGGFILPDSVRQAEILCDDSGVPVAPGTFPRIRGSAEHRRSLSSHR